MNHASSNSEPHQYAIDQIPARTDGLSAESPAATSRNPRTLRSGRLLSGLALAAAGLVAGGSIVGTVNALAAPEQTSSPTGLSRPADGQGGRQGRGLGPGSHNGGPRAGTVPPNGVPPNGAAPTAPPAGAGAGPTA